MDVKWWLDCLDEDYKNDDNIEQIREQREGVLNLIELREQQLNQIKSKIENRSKSNELLILTVMRLSSRFKDLQEKKDLEEEIKTLKLVLKELRKRERERIVSNKFRLKRAKEKFYGYVDPENIFLFCDPEDANKYCKNFILTINFYIDFWGIRKKRVFKNKYLQKWFEDADSAIVATYKIKVDFQEVEEIKRSLYEEFGPTVYAGVKFKPFEIIGTKGDIFTIVNDPFLYDEYDTRLIEDYENTPNGYDLNKTIKISHIGFDKPGYFAFDYVVFDQDGGDYILTNYLETKDSSALDYEKYVDGINVKKHCLDDEVLISILTEYYSEINKYISCGIKDSQDTINLVLDRDIRRTFSFSEKRDYENDEYYDNWDTF